MNQAWVLALCLAMSLATAQHNQSAAFSLAPIDSATPQSATFTLVNVTNCDQPTLMKAYELYSANNLVLQQCVLDAQYQMFPYPGVDPTPQQIGKMAKSLSCRALFSIGLFAGFPECSYAGFSHLASAQTMLKIAVDTDKYPNATNVIPTTKRFVDMVHWRRDVNLAEVANLPHDANSQLFAEYTSNLYGITTNGLLRLTPDNVIQYRSSVDKEFSQKDIALDPQHSGSSTLDTVVGGSRSSSTSSGSRSSKLNAKPSTSGNFAPASETASSAHRCRAAAVASVLVVTLIVII